jgi:arylsulfatase A-like enzyme
MFRDKRYKYVWNPTDLDELYDLEKDPYELVNRIDDDAAVLARLKNLMLDEMIRCADPLADVLAQEMGVNDK